MKKTEKDGEGTIKSQREKKDRDLIGGLLLV